jgi:tRNA pseudouridine38-40 synthase
MNGERNIRLLLAFDGTGYAGWQRQKELPTIQGVLEEKIAVMTDGPVTLHGAGRTDAGVHALGMVANFATRSTIPCSGFLKGLNSLLPEAIRVLDVIEAAA